MVSLCLRRGFESELICGGLTALQKLPEGVIIKPKVSRTAGKGKGKRKAKEETEEEDSASESEAEVKEEPESESAESSDAPQVSLSDILTGSQAEQQRYRQLRHTSSERKPRRPVRLSVLPSSCH